MAFDTKKFIREIESRKEIWDTSSEGYSDNDLKQRSWEEITNIMCEENSSENEKHEFRKYLQQKWRSIGKSFKEELKRKSGTKSESVASRTTPYVYFEQLQFLREIVVNNATQASIDRTDGDESNDESHNVEIRSPITNKAKKPNNDSLIEILKQNIAMRENREKKQESDLDRSFFRLLLNDFRKIPENQKLSTKIELMRIIKRAQIRTLEIPNQGDHCMSETSASDPYKHRYGLLPEALNSGQYSHGNSTLPDYRPEASSSGHKRRVDSTPVSDNQDTMMICNEDESSPTDSITVTDNSDTLDLINM